VIYIFLLSEVNSVVMALHIQPQCTDTRKKERKGKENNRKKQKGKKKRKKERKKKKNGRKEGKKKGKEKFHNYETHQRWGNLQARA
jgi:Ni/Co efflux regulator RcnB